MSQKAEGDFPTAAFDYELPPERIARHPAARRDESRLMVLDRAARTIENRRFRDIIGFIQPGDALVLNETRVIPARLIGRRQFGGRSEILLLQPGVVAGTWEALARPGARLRAGARVTVSDELSIEVIATTPDCGRIVRLDSPLPVDEALARYGRMPLPPYMDRAAEAEDRERYQTVYARADGSVAAPTAGLHFTPELLQSIEAKGVTIVRIVLHVGVGTFRPVEVADPSQHVMHTERYEVSDEAVAAIAATRSSGGRIWAVGTTVIRTLEAIADDHGNLTSGVGSTNLFIRPGYRFKVVDRLITNFHLPRSTLIMLVAAFGGYDFVMDAYRTAITGDYRFYSYGDAMVLI